MTGNDLNPQWADAAWEALCEASRKILEIYATSFRVMQKEDFSPVTEADLEADRIIQKYLNTTGIPVLSEESPLEIYSNRKNADWIWIVDPIDGTRDFVNRTDEFTVNIGLAYRGKIQAGWLSAPALGEYYAGIIGTGAWRWMKPKAQSFPATFSGFQQQAVSLPVPHVRNHTIVVGSISHPDGKTRKQVNQWKKEYPDLETQNIGSSLKFARLASGEADVYPRMHHLSEWDIAAGHAILEAAGGSVQEFETGFSLSYNKPDIRQPWFLAKSAAAQSFR